MFGPSWAPRGPLPEPQPDRERVEAYNTPWSRMRAPESASISSPCFGAAPGLGVLRAHLPWSCSHSASAGWCWLQSFSQAKALFFCKTSFKKAAESVFRGKLISDSSTRKDFSRAVWTDDSHGKVCARKRTSLPQTRLGCVRLNPQLRSVKGDFLHLLVIQVHFCFEPPFY